MNENQTNDDKSYMVHKIKQWLSLESQIVEKSKEIKQLRQMKKELNVDLLEIMKTHEIDCFDCKSGKIMYTKSNVRQGINKKYLNEVLQKFYGQENTSQAQQLCDYILDNRQIQVRENIKLKQKKDT
jgi:tRNA isopentenyl-2-thiomethyl-A-37 hydroxylase MiaE